MWNTTQQIQYRNVLKYHWPQQRSAFSYCLDEDLSPSHTHLQSGTTQTVHCRHIGRISSFQEDPLG